MVLRLGKPAPLNAHSAKGAAPSLLRSGGLEEIPLVAVEVFEDGDGAVGFLAWGLEETDAAGLIGVVIAPEVVGVKEAEDAAAGLVADGEGIARESPASAEERGRRRGNREGSYEEPAFACRGSGVSWSEVEA